MTVLRFFFIFVFLCTRSLFKKSSMYQAIIAKFERILSERFQNILKRSFKNHKDSEIACYPNN